MTAEPRKPLADRLGQQVDQFDPFEALRLIASGTGDGEALRVRGAITNRFLPTPLRPSVRTGEVELGFVGLVGPFGPLPPAYTEIALQEDRRRNGGLRAFFDLFVGRFASLFVGAHEKYRLPPLVARVGVDGMSAVTAALYSLIGIGIASLRERLGSDDWSTLPYAGLLIPDVRSGAGLAVMLCDQLGLPVRVEPFAKRWLPIEPHEQTSLGQDGNYDRLGVDAVAGARMLDVSSTFRIVVGPVDYGTFQWLMPGSPTMARLTKLVRFYADPGLDFDVQVILRKDCVPESVLGSAPPQLGWNSWLRQLPAEQDADQAIFDPGAS